MTRGTKAKRKGRGGARPGSGAPKGNQNAFKNGHRVADVTRRQFFESLDPQQLGFYQEMLEENGRRIPEADPAARPATLRALPANSPLITHTHRDTQSNNQPADRETAERIAKRRRRTETVIIALLNMGCYRAEDWVKVHRRRLSVLEAVLQDMEDDKLLRPDSAAAIRTEAAIFKDTVHLALMKRAGRVRQCPYCGLKTMFMVLPDPEEEDEDADLDEITEEAK